MRKALGLNQADLAEKLGVDQSTVSDIERGAGFGADLLMRLTDTLGGTAALIMEGKDNAVWPFPRVKIERFVALGPEQRAYVEGKLEAAIEACETGEGPSKPKLGIVPKEPEQDFDAPPEADFAKKFHRKRPGKRQA